MSNLAGNLRDSTNRHRDRLALRLDETEVTYFALDAASARVAGLLRARGVEPGDRVGIMLPNVSYFAIAYYGVLRAGGAVVPMNPLLKARESCGLNASVDAGACLTLLPRASVLRRPSRSSSGTA